MRQQRSQFLRLDDARWSYFECGRRACSVRHKSLPDPPTLGNPKQRDKMADRANPRGSQQDILRKRGQDFRAGVEKPFQLTSALREELKTTTTTAVLNV